MTDNVHLVRQFAEALAQDDPGAFDLLASDFIWRDNKNRLDKEQYKAAITAPLPKGADEKDIVADVSAAGDWVTVTTVSTATKPGQGVFRFSSRNNWRVAHSKIVEGKGGKVLVEKLDKVSGRWMFVEEWKE